MNRRYVATTIIALLGVVAFFLIRPIVNTPNWLKWLGPFSIAALVTCALIPSLRWLAVRTGLVDEPNERKVHEGSVPLVGGIAIYTGFLAANLVYGYHTQSPQVLAIMIALAPLLIIGVLDDIRDLPASLKLLVQMVAAAIVIAAGVRITFLPATWWGGTLEIAITALWLLGLTNAINFLDGLDGLATSLTMVATAAFGLVALQTGQEFFLLLCAVLCGACAGFLPFNFRRKPASTFLGDAGATLLGFSLASIAIVGEWGGGPGGITVDIVVPLLILGVPIFDTTFITVTRIANGKIRTLKQWLEYTGRDHIHHRLLNIGLNRFDAVGFICVLACVLSLSAIILKNATGLLAMLSLFQGVIILTIIGRFMLFVENHSAIGNRSTDGPIE